MKLSVALIATLVLSANAVEQVQRPLKGESGGRPNIVVILTDDQDLHLGSLDYMPLLKKHITDQGTFYKRHYCTTAICCPSRVTLWTGRNAHNTNVTDVYPPYGGYPKFVSQRWNENYLPLWLQTAGYNTYYTGKLFNAHSTSNWDSPHPAGWTSSDFLLDPHTYQYLNATFQRNDNLPVSHPGEYSTDLIAEKALGLLDEGVESGKPFFMVVAPIAPHADVNPINQHYINGTKQVVMTTPVPAERHKHLFPDAKVLRNAGFNPDKPSTPSWLATLPPLSEEAVASNDAFHRARLQALQAVDEMVESLVRRLERHDVLDNTYILYTSDNGYHISQHRLPPGKECGFEEDINVPLIVRGPGMLKGRESEEVSAHADLAPTILKLAGVGEGEWGWEGLDGSAIDFSGEGEQRGEHVNVEFWGRAIAEGEGGFSLDEGKVVVFKANNTYKALRIISEEYNLYYSVWCTNEHELYDLNTDPHQTTNLHPSISPPQSHPRPQVQYLPSTPHLPLSLLLPRLDALLLVTKSCAGTTCRDPWSALHPNSTIKSLSEALDPEFDAYYSSLADEGEEVGFGRCELGYVVESEGVQGVRSFEEWELDAEL